jgi:hypothetical protein
MRSRRSSISSPFRGRPAWERAERTAPLSGEEGKTQPSLASLLGVPCRCRELDVLAILDAEGQGEPVYDAPPVFGTGL